MRIFISHAVPDAALADALRDLYASAFDTSRVQVRYSSDQSPGGGIPPGKSWLDWIQEEVKAADRTLVLMTRLSLRRPWLLWESGAATGAGLVSEKSKLVVPVLFRVAPEQLPTPLQSQQVLHGDLEADIKRELEAVNSALSAPYPQPALNAVAAQFVPVYLAKVSAFLATPRVDDPVERARRDVLVAVASEAFGDKLKLALGSISLGFGTALPGLLVDGRPHTNAFGMEVSYDPTSTGADAVMELKALIEKIGRLRIQRETVTIRGLLDALTRVQGQAQKLVEQLRQIPVGTTTLAEPWAKAQSLLLHLWRQLSAEFSSFSDWELDRVREFLEHHPAYPTVHKEAAAEIENILRRGKVSLDELLVLTSDGFPKFLNRALEECEAQ